MFSICMHALCSLQNGGRNLLGYTDKNDQTVLHYAAFTGDEQVSKDVRATSPVDDSVSE